MNILHIVGIVFHIDQLLSLDLLLFLQQEMDHPQDHHEEQPVILPMEIPSLRNYSPCKIHIISDHSIVISTFTEDTSKMETMQKYDLHAYLPCHFTSGESDESKSSEWSRKETIRDIRMRIQLNTLHNKFVEKMDI